MIGTATEQQIEKLPKWAVEHITSLTREREAAVAALNKYIDGQSESPVFIDELESTGEERSDGRNPPSFKRRYVQAHRVSFEWLDIRLDVALERDSISLRWGTSDRAMSEVAFVPRAYQQAELKTKEQMR